MAGPHKADVLAIGITIVGLAVVFGWIFSFDEIKSIIPNQPTMKFSTALSFALSGLVLLSISHFKEEKYAVLSQIIMPASMLVILLLMIAHIASIILNVPSGIDNLFVEFDANSPETSVPGRPSLATILNFLLIAAAGLLFVSGTPHSQKILLWFGAAIAVIGGVATAGYVVGSPSLYYSFEGISNAVAFHTSILFVAAGVAMIWGARQGVERVLDGTRGISIRTKLVALFLISSVIPIIFIGGISLNSARIFSSATLAGSIYILGIATAISVALFALLISRSISAPILSLRRVIKEVTSGNYNVEVKASCKDEIGYLATDFDKMRQAVESTNRNLEHLVELRTTELVEKDKALENALQKLLDTEKAKDEFVSMVSHELKTPLVPIKGYSEMLLEPDTLGNLNEKQKKAVQTIFKSTNKMETLIGDVLDAFKLDMDKMKFAMSDIDAAGLINQTILDLQSIAEEKNIELKGEIADNITVFCDPGRIEQVLSNLIKNSVDFVPAKGGKIIMKAWKEITTSNATGEKDMAIFAVEDNGPGIPHDKIDNIFKKFYQIDTTITRKHGGTGLGLVVCKGIVEAHGGKIWIDTMYRNGACLKFTLPLSGKREGMQ